MTIKFDQFLGLFPKTNKAKLPHGAAVTATNCDMQSGVLKMSNPVGLTALHDDDATTPVMNGEINTGEILSSAAPSAPTVDSLDYICQPLVSTVEWLDTVTCYAFATHADTSGTIGEVITQVHSATLSSLTVEHTQYGLIIRGQLNADIASGASGDIFQGSVPYDTFGPFFSFTFADDSDGVTANYTNNGGPVISGGGTKTYPDIGTLIPTSPQLPLETRPLFWRGRHYASFNPTDFSGPSFALTGVTYDSNTNHTFAASGTQYTFFVNLNYAEAYYKYYRYAHSVYDQTEASATYGQEGPLSEPSEMIAIAPGQELTLQLNGTNLKAGRLYRADRDSGGKYYLVADENEIDGTSGTDSNDTWVDKGEGIIGDEAPLDGNIPAVDVNGSSDVIGSFYHPAGYAVVYYNDDSAGEYYVYPSEIAKPWQYPEEWRIPFASSVSAIALSGYQTIVWTSDGKVWGLSGGDPENLSKVELSGNHPLLAAKGICKIGSTIYYTTNDGLAVINGSSVEIISGSHYDRATWQALTPANFRAYVSDNSIWLRDDSAGTTGLKWDIEEDGIKLTTFSVNAWSLPTPTASSSGFTWESGTMRFERKTIMDYIRVTCEGGNLPTSVTVTVDGTDLSVTADANLPVAIPSTVHGYEWKVKIVGSSSTVVRSIELFEREVRTVENGVLRLTPDNTDCWENIRVRFPERDAFCCGYLSAQGDAGSTTLTINGTSYGIDPNNAFSLAEVTAADEHTISLSVDGDYRVDELVLMARRRVPVSGGVIHLTADDSNIPPWMYSEYEMDGVAPLAVGWYSGSGVTRVDINGSGQTGKTSETEFRITGVSSSSYTFSFGTGGADNYKVKEAVFIARDVINVPVSGVFEERDMQYGWASRWFRFSEPGAFASIKINASDYTGLTVNFYKDHGATPHFTIASGQIISNVEYAISTSMVDAEVWEVEIIHAGFLHNVYLAGRVTYEDRGGRVQMTHLGEQRSWKNRRVITPAKGEYTCFRINATGYPVVFNVEAEDGTDLIGSGGMSVESGAAFRFPKMPHQRVWIVSATPSAGYTINDITMATSMSRLG